MGHIGTLKRCIDIDLWPVIKGEELIDSLRLHNTILETDSLFAFDILEKPDLYTKSSFWKAKISDYQKLVKKNGITLNSITDEENKCARFMADIAVDDDEDDDDDDEYEDVLDPPPGIENLMIADKGNMAHD